MRYLAVFLSLALFFGATFDASAMTCSSRMMLEKMDSRAQSSVEAASLAADGAHHASGHTAASAMPCHETGQQAGDPKQDGPKQDGRDSDQQGAGVCCCSLMAHAAVFPTPAPLTSWRIRHDWELPPQVVAASHTPGLEKPPPRA